MDDQLYREIILEHWKNPQNYGVIDDADIDISDSNPLCGDEIRITASLIIPNSVRNPDVSSANDGILKQVQEDSAITDIKFICQGCAISKASGSILTELVKEIGLTAFKNLDQSSYLNNLEVNLTPARLKCALLPYSALQKALT